MSDLLYRFSQQPQTLLTNIGQGARQLGGQLIQAEQGRRKEEAYQTAIGAFREDNSPENLMNVFNVNPEKFESFKQAFDAMNELERTQTVQGNVELMGLLASGNEDKAIENAQTRAEAYRNSGDEGQAKVWDGFAEKIENGEGQDLTNYLMSINMGAGKIGQDANQSWYDMTEDKRAEVASQGKIFEQALKNSFSSEEDRQKFYKTAEGHNLETVAMLAELAGVKSMGGNGMDTGEFFKAEQSLRKEYDSYISGYLTMVQGAETISALAQLDTGFADQGMIMLFNKVLDPPSVVRESEAKMTAANQGIMDKARTLVSNLKDGDRLSVVGRKGLAEAVNLIGGLAQDRKADEKARIMKTVEAYGFGADRIFIEETKGTPAVTETKEIASVSNVVSKVSEDRLEALRAHVKLNNPQSSADFANMTEDQLNKYNASKTFVYSDEATEEETVEVDY